LSLHPVLQRQLGRLDLDVERPPDAAAWRGLLERVSLAYRTADEHRYTLERSLDLSSRELTALNEEMRQRLRETETLLLISQTMAEDVPLAEVLRQMSRAAARALGADTVAVYVRNADSDTLRGVAGYHVPGALRAATSPRRIPLRGHPAVEEMWRTQRPVHSGDVPADPRFAQRLLDHWPMRSVLLAPVIANGAPLGALVAVWWSAVHEFTEAELRIAEGIGRQAAMAVRHRQAGAELRWAHAQTEQLLASVAWILVAVDAEGRITRWNTAAERAFGLSRDEAVGRLAVEVAIAWPWPAVREALVAAATAGRQSSRLDDIRYRRPDGNEGYLAGRVTALPEAGEATGGFVLLGFDVSERRILEAQLAQAQKLESIGQLAAGVAHEINTPIQFVGDNARFLQTAFDGLLGLVEVYGRLRTAASAGAVDPALLEEVAEREASADLAYLMDEVPTASRQTIEGINRVASIVRALKEFAHPNQTERIATDVNHALLTTLTVARNEVKYVADVQTDLGELPLVVCQPGELNQVFLNIVVNAAHAIADVVGASGARGRITIRTVAEDDWVLIAISDTGGGIPEAIRGRIFDPFFTTKAVGRGTGQGLALARAFVERHGGSLTFETEPGRGTTFLVRLPVAGTGAARPAAPAGGER
jgi:PAS domain S-box-containing protein